jgi:hypothetical protein
MKTPNDMDAAMKEKILLLWRQGSNTWVIAQRAGAPEATAIDVVEGEQLRGRAALFTGD